MVSICFCSFFCQPVIGEGTLWRILIYGYSLSADAGTDWDTCLTLVDFLFENMSYERGCGALGLPIVGFCRKRCCSSLIGVGSALRQLVYSQTRISDFCFSVGDILDTYVKATGGTYFIFRPCLTYPFFIYIDLLYTNALWFYSFVLLRIVQTAQKPIMPTVAPSFNILALPWSDYSAITL